MSALQANCYLLHSIFLPGNVFGKNSPMLFLFYDYIREQTPLQSIL